MADQGISAELLKDFVASLASLLIPVMLGGALGAKEIFKLSHVEGMMSFIFWVGLPALVFRRLALSEPGALDLRLLGADALSKLIPLALLLLWRKLFSKSGRIESFERVITFFMLSSIPNTVLIGDAVLNPIFGVQIETKTTTIIFAQSLYWYNVCIILFEIRELMAEDEKAKITLPTVGAIDKSATDKSRIQSMHQDKNLLVSTFGSGHGYGAAIHAAESDDGTHSRCSTRALSCSSRSFSINSPGDSLAQSFSSAVYKITPIDDRDEKPGGTASGRAATEATNLQTDQGQVHSSVSGHSRNGPPVRPSPQADYASKKQQQLREFENQRALRQLELELGRSLGLEGFRPINEEFGADPAQKKCWMSRCSCYASCGAKLSFAKVSSIRIVKRVFKTPFIYVSVFGFVYSIFAIRFHWRMPSFLLSTLSFLADGAIGLAMVAIGMLLASSVLASKSLRGLVPCGLNWLLAGFAARYIAAPIFMYVGSLAFLLKGTVLRYAITQVVIAQGSMGFALAKQYNCDVTIILAATVIQMFSFIPVILAYYAFVEAI